MSLMVPRCTGNLRQHNYNQYMRSVLKQEVGHCDGRLLKNDVSYLGASCRYSGHVFHYNFT